MSPVSLRRGPRGIVERVELEQEPRAGHSGSSQGLRACDGTRGMLNAQRSWVSCARWSYTGSLWGNEGSGSA